MFQKAYLWVENVILTRLVPLDSPGPIFKWIFKLPLLLYRVGLGWSLGGRVLLLTTVGRKTGRLRQTPLEYQYDPQADRYEVMAGWGGKTDWYCNARANPNVSVQVGRRSFEAVAELAPETEVARALMEFTRINPGALRMLSRWTDEPLYGTEAGFYRAAPDFPMLYLRPVDNELY